MTSCIMYEKGSWPHFLCPCDFDVMYKKQDSGKRSPYVVGLSYATNRVTSTFKFQCEPFKLLPPSCFREAAFGKNGLTFSQDQACATFDFLTGSSVCNLQLPEC